MSENQTMAKVAKKSGAITKSTFFFSVAVIALISFVAGTRSNEILAAVGPVFGFKAAGSQLDLSSVQSTYQALKENYSGELNDRLLIDGANKGMVDAVGDEYTTYMDAEEAKEFDESLTGNIGGGIGAEIGKKEDRPTIIRVLPDNPAEKAGVKAGDVIVSVNDESVAEKTVEEIVAKIRGQVGTTVKLTVARGDAPQEFTITRETVNNPSVQSKLEGDIGILTVSRFDNETVTLAKNAVQKMKQQGMKRIVVDLRDNRGGYLNAAQDLSGLWLDNKVVVTERKGDEVIETLRSGSDTILKDVPTVLLVNGNSASASEIVAGALKDYEVATLVGEKTYGKGTVQKIMKLQNGAQLKVTIAQWFTPKGKNISKEGIAPDVEVKMTAADVNANRDPQMSRALKVVNE